MTSFLGNIKVAVEEFRDASVAYERARAAYEDTSIDVALAKRGKGDMTEEQATKAQRRFVTETWSPAYNRRSDAAKAVLEALGFDADERANFKGSLR